MRQSLHRKSIVLRPLLVGIIRVLLCVPFVNIDHLSRHFYLRAMRTHLNNLFGKSASDSLHNLSLTPEFVGDVLSGFPCTPTS